MRTGLFAFWVVSGLSVPAFAGPVSQAARGVDNKQETHDDSRDSAPPAREDTHESHHHDDDDACLACGSAVLVSDSDTAGSVTEDGIEGIELEGPTRLDAYLGAHAVVHSDGAAVFDLRLHRDFLGLSASGSSYFEQVSDGGRMDSVRLDLWSVSLAGRLARAEDTELWIEGGPALTTSTEYDPLAGLQIALRVQHRIRPDLELFGRARYHGFMDDVSAVEGWGGVRAWILAAGYRSLQFNFGPPIHGPEAGISLEF
jgi:hypothetical protein